MILLLGAVLGSLLAFQDFRFSEGQSQELSELLQGAGIENRHPELAHRLASEPCRWTGRLLLARALVADSQDVRWISRLPVEGLETETARIRQRLELAERLATEAYPHMPAAWQAPMLVGASRFLRTWRSDSRSLLSQSQVWMEPLQQSLELAPNQAEPKRVLATGYLTIWHGLSEMMRNEAKSLLLVAMEDRGTFDRLLPAWLQAAASREEALDHLPDTSYTWKRIAGLASQQRDWDLFGDVRHRFRHSLHLELEDRLADAHRRLSGGDLGGGRSSLLELLAAAPTEMAFVDLFRRGFEALPPGPVGPSWATALSRWRDWVLELAVLRESPLPGNLIRRLAGITGSPPTEVAALASLLGGDLAAAERLERRAESIWHEAWSPYLIAKARELVRRGDKEEARRTLERVHLNQASALSFQVAQASMEGDGDSISASLSRDSWSARDWRWQGKSPRLAFWPPETAEELLLDIAQAPADGAVVEIQLDGVYKQSTPVYPGSRVSIALEGEPPHLLVLETVAGGKVVPGKVVVE